MHKLFFSLIFSFVILFVLNITWVFLNLYLWINFGISEVLVDENEMLFENIYYSSHVRWIILFDLTWIASLIIFLIRRKKFRTDINLHYLKNNPISAPKITVAIPTYNEERAIEKTVTEYLNQQFVEQVLIIDNNSTDDTVILAQKHGATVIQKDQNRGFGHSFLMGLEESIKTDSNIIVMTEADDTYDPNDIQKFLQYIAHCDLVTGSRQAQVLNEKDNQNGYIHTWGNYLLAKLIQFKFINLGLVGTDLNEVGCGYLAIRKTALKQVIEKLKTRDTEKSPWNVGIRLYLLLLFLETDLKIIEVPVSFKKRIGESKIGSLNFSKAIKIGFSFLWIILRY